MEKIKQESNWSPIKTFTDKAYKPVDGGDHLGAGCLNIARAIILGLTYIGDCVKDNNLSGQQSDQERSNSNTSDSD